MREQGDGQAKRGYRKGKRAADEARTRTRIVDAAEHLHGTVGPARTTIAAVAAGAHVTRATVYRHFADEESLFLACSSQWLARQDLPRPAAWRLVGDPAGRLRRGLADIYRYYRSGEEMLSLVVRDVEAVPAVVAAARRSREREWVTTLLSAYPGRRRTVLRAAVAHAAAFTTWQSLCSGQDLSDRSAVELMVGMVERCESEGSGTGQTR